MKVFVAGGTGVIGRSLLPLLIGHGHEVTALTRSPEGAERIRQLGAEPAVCDVFDRRRLGEWVVKAEPEVVIHQLTAIPKRLNPRRIRKELAQTNRLRTEGTQILMEAAQAAGVTRFIAQSIAFAYAPEGEALTKEEERLYLDAPASFVEIMQAVDSLERTVVQASGIESFVLRYGYFQGPGTVYAEDGTFAADVRRRRVPVVGEGTGVFSFIHVDDAASATVAALTATEPGTYNIVDDEPAALREWLPRYAKWLGAPAPYRIPRFIGALAAGPYAIYLMVQQRGVSNEKARKLLSWQPKYRNWQGGFRPVSDVVGDRPTA